LFDKDKAKKLFLDGIKTNLFLLTPVSILMIFLSDPIVSLLFERGNFNVIMVKETAFALKFYSIGLIGWGIHSLTARIFSARMDIKTSMKLNFFMLLTNVGLSIYLVSTSLKFAGLALATSISFILFSFIRVAVLKNCLKKEDIFIKYKEISISFIKTLLASLFMIIVLVQAKFIFDQIEFTSKPVGNLVLLI
jgi:putative peptidoglycan lipid II flippase